MLRGLVSDAAGTPGVSAWGRAHQNTLQHTHEISGRLSHTTMRSWYPIGHAQTGEAVPGKAAGKSAGTLYQRPLSHSLMLFITLSAATDGSQVGGEDQILETFLKDMTSDTVKAKFSTVEFNMFNDTFRTYVGISHQCLKKLGHIHPKHTREGTVFACQQFTCCVYSSISFASLTKSHKA